MATITVTPECNAQIKQYAAEKGCTADEAAVSLIDTAIGRLTAVRRYAKKIAKAGVPAKSKGKKVKAAPAKKAKAKKAAKPAKVEAAA